MNKVDFERLDLKYWDYISFFMPGGNHCMGNYEEEYDSTYGTFLFSNHSTGRSERIRISEIEQLEKG